MESNRTGKISVKFTLLISILDKSKQVLDPRFFKILLDNNRELPSIYIDEYNEEDYMRVPDIVLHKLSSKYIKYSFDFLNKIPCGFRFINKNECEIVYITVLNYVPGLNKDGSIYTLDELEERDIKIDDYYRELFARHGCTIR